jgi:hypothetical protein
MKKYSKLFGAAAGFLTGLVVSHFGLPEELGPQIEQGLVGLFTLIGTYIFPANA